MKIIVYLVQEENYDDDEWFATYSPVKAFYSKEKAEEFVKKQRDPALYDIEMITVE